MIRKLLLVLSIVILASTLPGCIEPTEYMVEMRDGVHLATDVYLPPNLNEPHGVILIRTPYNKDNLRLVGISFAKSGWPTVIQDMRGRFASEGIDTVFRNAHTDGPDTLEWIASQEWCNGKIATFGGSALGINQYFMAGANPRHLACQFISVATPEFYKHAVYQGGEFRKSLVELWLQAQGSLFILPEYFEHENYTLDYWTNITLEDKWSNVNIPAVHLGGWYDIFLQGTIDGFMGYQYKGGPGARGKSKLVIGPWTHGKHGVEQGELVYPDNAEDNFSFAMFVDMIEEYTMNQGNDFDKWPTVIYYVMGAVNETNAPGNQWRVADNWPPLPYTETKWYLHGDGLLSREYPGDYSPITYTYDPSDPVPTIGGQNLNIPAGPYDQRSVEGREDILVFNSPVLEEPFEATGPVKAILYVSSDCIDTDFTVKLIDVYPDGRAMLITDSIIRMRNRNGFDHWEFMEPGEIYKVEVDLWSTSYIWNKGHRIRVDISSSNYPRFLANPNTGEPMGRNTTYKVAHNTIYLDSLHPSCIVLPWIKSTENTKTLWEFLRETKFNTPPLLGRKPFFS
ncbi:MAG TPA: CocE/NonD family hydrolase [Thermoplasmatales archaeon]|nr:CocE/NonD family hydrolase [Thermoplasmatales archaeon]